jgi:hypothetical protein
VQLELTKTILREVSHEPVTFSLLKKRVLIKTGTYATVTCLIYFLHDSGFIVKGACDFRARASAGNPLFAVEALAWAEL